MTAYRIGDTSDAICQEPDTRCFDWFELTDPDFLGLQKELVAVEGSLQPEQLDPEGRLYRTVFAIAQYGGQVYHYQATHRGGYKARGDSLSLGESDVPPPAPSRKSSSTTAT